MHPVTVTIRSDNEASKDLDVEGYVPFVDCPIAVTPFFVHRAKTIIWDMTDRWSITHRPTGYQLGAENTWATREESMAVLLRCDPTFAAWPLATGDDDCAATNACKIKMREALQGG